MKLSSELKESLYKLKTSGSIETSEGIMNNKYKLN